MKVDPDIGIWPFLILVFLAIITLFESAYIAYGIWTTFHGLDPVLILPVALLGLSGAVVLGAWACWPWQKEAVDEPPGHIRLARLSVNSPPVSLSLDVKCDPALRDKLYIRRGISAVGPV